MLHAIVHPANIQDRDGGVLLLATLFGMYPFLKKLFADGGYQGRIALRWSASDPDLAAALTEHASLIAGEVLATEYGPEVATGSAPEHADTELGLRFWLKRA